MEAEDFLVEAKQQRLKWDYIILDPPSFSTYPKPRGLDIRRDHPNLIKLALKVLRVGGHLIFSTNHQRFIPNFDNIHGFTEIEELTPKSIPVDYRNKKIHQSYLIKKLRGDK